MGHASLVFVHILLMVFWIGTDIGVFIAGFYFMNPRLSVDQRRTAIELGLVIDRFPRLCFVAILPVGAQLAWDRGLLPFGAGAMAAVWAASAVWLAAAVVGMVAPGRPAARVSHGIERMFQLAALLGLTGAGLAALAHAAPLPPWLAGKLIAFGLVCLFAIGLEQAFGPAIGAFAEITESGSQPAREARLRRAMWTTYGWVLAIYACVLGAGWLGATKV
jgi:hypothetical protein